MPIHLSVCSQNYLSRKCSLYSAFRLKQIVFILNCDACVLNGCENYFAMATKRQVMRNERRENLQNSKLVILISDLHVIVYMLSISVIKPLPSADQMTLLGLEYGSKRVWIS